MLYVTLLIVFLGFIFALIVEVFLLTLIVMFVWWLASMVFPLPVVSFSKSIIISLLIIIISKVYKLYFK